MRLISPVSFTGKIKRPTYYDYKNKTTYTPSRKDIEQSYDDQIDIVVQEAKEKIDWIKEYKQNALNLDDMMHNNPKIQKAIEESPIDIEIQNEAGDDMAGYVQYDDYPCCLTADEEAMKKTDKWETLNCEEQYKLKELEIVGEPDEQEILGWLGKIKSFLNND